jgi:TusA-related sulfurtransferase
MYADKVVNCMGSCVSPMLLIDEEMGLLERGQILQVMTDKPDLAETVRKWAGENGHNIEEEEKTSGVISLILRKGTAAKAEAT